MPTTGRILTISFLLTILTFGTGCFSRFVMRPAELRTYFRDKPVKPDYYTIENDSVRLFCASAGSDSLPALLLVHGAPGAWYGSRQMLTDSTLLRHFQVIAVDRPGYNKSRLRGKKKAFTSIENQSRALHLALRLNRSGQPAVLLGSSYGGPIAARMAIDHPHDFSRLIMLAPALDPDKEKFWWFHPFIRRGPISWLLPRFINHATDEKFAHVAELQKMLPLWQKLTTPVTILQGSADRIVEPSNLDFARQHIRNCRAEFILVPGAGHLLRWQEAELVKRILLQQEPGNPNKR